MRDRGFLDSVPLLDCASGRYLWAYKNKLESMFFFLSSRPKSFFSFGEFAYLEGGELGCFSLNPMLPVLEMALVI